MAHTRISNDVKRLRQEAVDKNYEAFKRLGNDFYSQHYGRYALMRDEEVVALFSSGQDARQAAKLLYEDDLFSIQKVEREEMDLGYYSHAVF